MKKISSFMVFVMLVAALFPITRPASNKAYAESGSQQSFNLIANGGFESLDESGWATGWTKAVYDKSSPEITVASDVYAEGSHALRIRPTGETRVRASASQYIDVESGARYRISYKVKTDNIQSPYSNGATVRVQFINSSNTAVASIYLGKRLGTTDWTEHIEEFDIPDYGVKIRVEAFLWAATGTAWFDDLNIERAGIPVTGIQLDKSSGTIEVGQSETLQASVQPANATNQTVVWETSDPAVASVNQGVVQGIGIGTAVITAKTVEGGFTATYNVTVQAANLLKNYSFENTDPSGSPDAWTFMPHSGNPEMATVSDVTQHGTKSLKLFASAASSAGVTQEVHTLPGKKYRLVYWLKTDQISGSEPGAFVKVRFVDDHNVEISSSVLDSHTGTLDWSMSDHTFDTPGGASKMQVEAGMQASTGTVWFDNFRLTDENIPVTGVRLNKHELTVETGKEERLEAEVLPENASNPNLLWESSDPGVATVEQGVVRGVSFGTAVITVRTEEGGYAASAAVTVGGTNLLRNSGFETPGAEGAADQWVVRTYEGADAAQLSLDTGDYVEGGKSLKIFAESDARVSVSQDFAVTAGKYYKLAQWVKTKEVVSGYYGGALRIQYFDSNGAPLHSTVLGGWKGTAHWKQTEYVIHTPKGAVTARAEYFLWLGKGTVWFDHIRVLEVPKENLFVNSGFESLSSGGFADSWNVAKYGGTAELTVVDHVYHSGSRSVLIESDSSQRASIFQDIAVNGGQYYKLKQWVKTENVVSGYQGGTIRVQYYDKDNRSLGTAFLGSWSGTNEWNPYEYTVQMSPETVKMRVEYFLWYGSGKVWFDDVRILPVSYPGPTGVKAVRGVDGSGNTTIYWNWDEGDTQTVSIYGFSSLPSDDNISSAQLLMEELPASQKEATVQLDTTTHPYIGLVLVDSEKGRSSVSGAKVEDYVVVPPSRVETVQGFDNSIRTEWSLPEVNAQLLEGSTVSIYAGRSELNQARLLADDLPITRQRAVLDIDANEYPFVGIVIKDRFGRTSEVAGGRVIVAPSILPNADEAATANRQHPFLFYPKDILEQAKEKIQKYAWAKESYENVKAQVDSAVNSENIEYPPFGTGRRDLFGTINQFMVTVRNAGLLYQLTGDVKYAEYVKTVLTDLAADYPNLPKADATGARWDFELLAEVRHMINLMNAYDLIMPSGLLNESEQLAIENNLFRINYEASRHHIETRDNKFSNWITWMDASVGITGILLNRPDWVDYAVNDPVTGIKNNLINNVNEDGFFFENSTAYLKFTSLAVIDLAEALYNANLDLYNVKISGTRARDGVTITDKQPIHEMFHALNNYIYSDMYVPQVGDSDRAVYDPIIRNGILGENELIYLRYNRDPYLAQMLIKSYGKHRSQMPRDVSFIFAEPLDELDQQSFVIGTNSFAKQGYNWLGNTVFGDTGAVFFRSPGNYDSTNMVMYWDPYGAGTGHYHSDKLGINVNLLGREFIKEAGPISYDVNSAQIPWARTTIAHNTVVVDETSQKPQALQPWYLWAGDPAGESTAGQLKSLSLGPVFRGVRAFNDKVYGGTLPIYETTMNRNKIEDRLFDVTLDRTVVMIDDYLVDFFQVKSPYNHQYDYPLNFPAAKSNGSVSGNVAMAAVEGNLGVRNGYDYIKGVDKGTTSEDWSFALSRPEGEMNIRMIGADETQIIHGTTYNNNSILVARRGQAKETEFAAVIEPVRTGSEITGFAYTETTGSAKGMKIEKSDNSDFVVVGTGDGEKTLRETGFSTNGNLAFQRIDASGQEKVIGFTKGTYARTDSLSLEADRAVESLQMTEMLPAVYRIDFSGAVGTSVKVKSGNLQAKVYALNAEGRPSGEVPFTREGEYLVFASQTAMQAFAVGAEERIGELPESARVIVGNNLNSGLQEATVGTIGLDVSDNENIVIEAEAFTVQEGGEVEIVNKPGAQPAEGNNSFRLWDYGGHLLGWTFNVEHPGDYIVKLRYANNVFDATRTFQTGDSDMYNVYFPDTGGWNNWRDVFLKDAGGNPLTFRLKKGENRITMVNSSRGAAGTNLDYIELIRLKGSEKKGKP